MNETPITIEYLQEVLAKCASTTPGPWVSFIEGRDHDSGSSFIRTGGNDIELSGATDADQDFIASAKQDIPALVAEIIRLKGWSL
jgi:hypothetical protein